MADNQTEFWRRVLNPPTASGVNSLVEFSQDGVDPIGALQFPVGTTAERPSVPVNGMMRYNTTAGNFEFYDNVWLAVSGVGGTSLDKIEDADVDTAILVENSTGVDDDIIAMTIGDNSGTFTLPTTVFSFSTAGFTIETPAGASGGTPGVDFSVTTGAGNLAGRGGDISFAGGIGGTTGDGGDIQLTAGDGGVSGGGLAGTINLDAGDGGSAVPGGAITLTAGDGDTNVGGAVNIQAGTVSSGTGVGGAVNIDAGDSGASGVGGAINIEAGVGSEATGGAISIVSGDGTVGGTGGQWFASAGDGDGGADGGAVSISAGDGGLGGGDSGGAVTIATGSGTTDGAMRFDIGIIEGLSIEVDGTLSVPTTTAGSAAYETQVTDDDDIPNKKYVDDSIISGAGINNVVEDTTPQLGGALDLNSNDITDSGKIKWDSTNTQMAVGSDITSFTWEATTINPVLNVELLSTGSPVNISMAMHSNTASQGPRIMGYRSRGLDNSPDAGDVVVSGDKLIEIAGTGWDSVDYAEGGRIQLLVDGTPGANDMPGRWVFLTTPDGAENAVERLRIESDGTLSVQGTTSYEALVISDDDVPNRKFLFDNFAGKQSKYISASEMRPTVTAGCADLVDVETTAGNPDLQVLDFDASSDEHAQLEFAFPNSWDLSTVSFQVFWTTTAVDADGVAWALQGVFVADGDTIDVAYGTPVVVTDDAQTAAEDVLVTVESSAVTLGGTPADGGMTYFRLFRDVSDPNDDMAEDARLIGIKLFFTTDAGNDA